MTILEPHYVMHVIDDEFAAARDDAARAVAYLIAHGLGEIQQEFN